eukprot:TRINITY_DN7087_c0_g1_i1.p1 TRINITY_DN7087_c0_g1~~TRINITY_DN7087_c0_g1_i1.p1  ORF type:complete len:679 (-),score=169.31 TRINITY_DN7087_c0_g1_i1:38-2074(-)
MSNSTAHRPSLNRNNDVGLFFNRTFGTTIVRDAAELMKGNSGDLTNFPLSTQILNALRAKGVTKLFPIQSETFNIISSGKNLIAKARTGTGKTLAFVLPIAEKLIKLPRASSPRVLIMAPTRELAKQTTDEFESISPNLRILPVYGGTAYQPQEAALRKGVDVIVGTPGRIIDLMNKGTLRLNEIDYVILDEADAMLKIGFQEEMDQILAAIPKKESNQFMLFSATIPNWIRNVSRQYLGDDYMTVDLVGDESIKSATTISHHCINLDPRVKKDSVIANLIRKYADGGRTIVFTQTKMEATELAHSPHLTTLSKAIHGDISQQLREMTLRSLKEKTLNCLIATDVAARGLDIPSVDLVVHASPPQDVESYIHRSGRTGRAGRSGTAVCLYHPNDLQNMSTIEREVGIKFNRLGVPSTQDNLNLPKIVKSLEEVSDAVLPTFDSTAKELQDKLGSTKAISTLLAKLSGHISPCTRHSLLNGSENYTTMKVITNRPIRMQSDAIMIAQSFTNQFGDIGLCQDENSFVVDVPYSQAESLLNKKNEHKIEIVQELPPLKDPLGRPRYGGSGGSGNRFGGGSGNRFGGGSGNRFPGSGNRYGGNFGDNRRSGGGYEDRRSGNFDDNRRSGGYGNRDRSDRSGGSGYGSGERSRYGDRSFQRSESKPVDRQFEQNFDSLFKREN